MAQATHHRLKRALYIGASALLAMYFIYELWQLGVSGHTAGGVNVGLSFAQVLSIIPYFGSLAIAFALYAFAGKLVRMLPDERDRHRMRRQMLWLGAAVFIWLYVIAFPLTLINLPPT